MKPKHNAETRLSHYKEALRRAYNNYPKGIYHTCLTLLILNKGESINMEKDYPEFARFKRYDVGVLDSWFSGNEQRIEAIKKAITETSDKIYRNELD